MSSFYDFSELKSTVEREFQIEVDVSIGKIQYEVKVERLQSNEIDKIVFEDGKIILKDGDQQFVGFLVKEENYRKAYPDYVLGRPSFLPKFHTTLCEVLEKRKMKGSFDGVYIFSNEVIKRNDPANSLKQESDLRVCSKCKDLDDRIDEFVVTEEFVNEILKKDQSNKGFKKFELPKEFEKDEWGYLHGWDVISLSYRKKKNYTCEKCKLDLSGNKYFLEVHHKNGNKTNNRESNLQCLCVACHANVDSYHRENYYNQPNNKEKLHKFRELYKK